MKIRQLSKLFVLVAFTFVNVGAQIILNGVPSRVLGAPRVNVNNVNPNLVEGRELFAPQSVAYDTTNGSAILYVADTGNNRVLAWRNATAAQNGITADLVIGQRDLLSTLPSGPSSGFSVGLAAPTGVAVDRSGNLWVVDSGNNRVLRYSRPFAQTGEFVAADVVVGQPNFNSRGQNGSQALVNASGFSMSTTNSTFRSSIAFDGDGNLWVVDPNNHRVLRFAAASLNSINPAANLVIGQGDFTSRLTATVNANNRIRKDILNTPSGIAFDTGGRLFLTDGFFRVSVFFPPFTANGAPAQRILGVPVQGAGAINNISLGVTPFNTSQAPEGVFPIGNSIAVVDVAANRIVRYPPVSEWPAEATQFSPLMSAVYGQPDFSSGRPWAGSPEAGGGVYNAPIAAAANAAGDEIFVADANSHRVVRLGGANFASPLTVFGQTGFTFSGANLVEGREFNFVTSFVTVSGISGQQFANGTGIAFEGNRLYVADTQNHRVLGFRDARSFRNGDPADLVIGQPDLQRVVLNYPGGDANALPNESSLAFPAGVAVDANGDLYVADSGNGRVLRFPRPFDQNPINRQRANLVLGQLSFTTRNTDASSRTMSRPFGLAFLSDGSLLASDAAHSRVLLFQRPAGGDFTIGQAATSVFGQPDFVTTSVSNEIRRLALPRGIATDTDDRLYVCDTGKARVVIFNRATIPVTDPSPALVIAGPTNSGTNNPPFTSPHGIYVSPRTGEIWVANTLRNIIQRFPRFDQLVINQNSDFQIGARLPLGLSEDQFGNLFVADGNNRVAAYYPGLAVRHGANFLLTQQRPIAPNTYGSLGSFGAPLSESTVSFDSLPNPIPMATTLGDTQVLLNERPANLSFVSPSQINFLVPNDAPTSGTMEVQVVRPSTGQIIAAGTIQMAPTAPGFFSVASSGVGQLAAINQDNTVNGPANPALRGSVIALFGTGLGTVSGAPEPGVPPTGPVPGPTPRVIVGTDFVPDDHIQYSGLAPGLIGVWQLNVRIPENLAPSAAVRVAVVLNSLATPIAPAVTTIAVRQ
jgi:uncharacterized protein (TIGR03437 family)